MAGRLMAGRLRTALAVAAGAGPNLRMAQRQRAWHGAREGPCARALPDEAEGCGLFGAVVGAGHRVLADGRIDAVDADHHQRAVTGGREAGDAEGIEGPLVEVLGQLQ